MLAGGEGSFRRQEEPEEKERETDLQKPAKTESDVSPEKKKASPAEEKEPVTRESLEKKSVAKLRSLARELKLPGMTSKDICFAKKQQLIDAIISFMEQEK